MSKADIQTEFENKRPKYQKLAINLVDAIESFLRDEGVSYLSVTHRLKKFDSFWEKIARKGYKNPFSQIEDICGIRVIVYFPSDVKRVDEIIIREFDVVGSEDKSEVLSSDQFGYRSDHHIVRVKAEWLKAPNWRGLNNLKAEIQVRTILMHSWADLSHKLAYKTETAAPRQFMRELYQLSALFELADEKFETLRNKKESLIQEIVSASEASGFDVSQELNVDVLQAYLNYRFPDREKSGTDEVMDMLDEMKEAGISLAALDDLYKQAEPKLQEMEIISIPHGSDFDKWAQLGMVRMILDYLHPGYAQFRDVGETEMEVIQKLFA